MLPSVYSFSGRILIVEKVKRGLNECIELRFDQFVFGCQYFVNSVSTCCQCKNLSFNKGRKPC